MNRRTALSHLSLAGVYSFTSTRHATARGMRPPQDAKSETSQVRGPTNVRELALEPLEVVSAAFSPDGKTVALGATELGAGAIVDRQSLDGSGRPPGVVTHGKTVVQLWDVSSGRRLLELGAHTAPVLDVAFDAAGTRLASAGVAGYAASYEPIRQNTSDRRTMAAGRELHAGWSGGLIKVWDVTSGRETLSVNHKPAPVACVALGRFLTAIDLGQVVTMWGSTDGVRLPILAKLERPNSLASKYHNTNVSITANATRAVLVGERACFWDLSLGTCREWGQGETRGPVTMSQNGEQFASWSATGTPLIWDFKSLALLRECAAPPNSSDRRAPFGVLAFSRAGDQIAAVWDNGNALSWDVPSGKLVAGGKGPPGAVCASAYTAGGRLQIASGGRATARPDANGVKIEPLRIWDLDLA